MGHGGNKDSGRGNQLGRKQLRSRWVSTVHEEGIGHNETHVYAAASSPALSAAALTCLYTHNATAL